MPLREKFMRPLADILVFSPNYQMQLAVQVLGKKETTDAWACEMRQHYLDVGVVPASVYFLLVSANYLYLWLPNAPEGEAPANYKVRLPKAFGRFARVNELDRFGGYGSESMVGDWFSSLIWHGASRETDPQLDWLFDSGLYEKLRVE